MRIAILGALLCAACSGPQIPPSPPPGMGEAVSEQATAMGGSIQVGEILAQVTREEDQSVTIQARLKRNKCYVFSAIGDSRTVEALKLYVFNPNGKRAMTQANKNARVSGSFCVTGQPIVNITPVGWGSSVAMAVPGIYKIEVKTTEGYGHVAVGVFESGE